MIMSSLQSVITIIKRKKKQSRRNLKKLEKKKTRERIAQIYSNINISFKKNQKLLGRIHRIHRILSLKVLFFMT